MGIEKVVRFVGVGQFDPLDPRFIVVDRAVPTSDVFLFKGRYELKVPLRGTDLAREEVRRC